MMHVAGQHDERHVLLLQQFHLRSLHLGFVRVVLVDAPHVVGDAEHQCHVAQVLVIAHDAGDVNVKFSSLPTCKQVVETVAHLADEDSHAWALVIKVKVERHTVTLGIEGVYIFLNFLSGNKKSLQFPFYTHEKHAVLMVNILVKIDDVALVVGDEFGYFRNNALLVGAVQKHDGCWFHFYVASFYYSFNS